jgi:predicted DNA-binding transcriptional regulator AlpA
VTISFVPEATNQPTMQVDDVAKALGLSRAAAYNGVQTGEIPSIRIGRIVVPTAAVRRMLQLDGGADG